MKTPCQRRTKTDFKVQLYSSMIPMGRFGQPSEIAAAIAFFCSDDAAFITGQTLFIDGGASIGRSLI